MAATITASYEQGRADVVINGYGTPAMGTFRLVDGSETHLALCIEAHLAHSTESDAYAAAAPAVRSAPLDALLWWLDRQPAIDDDTAVAAAALAWYYAGARRSIGPPVWSDGARGFAAITPDSPESWDALRPFSVSHPVGLIVPGTHLDAAERRVAELHRIASGLSGTWALDVTAGADAATIRLTIGGSPAAARRVRVSVVSGEGAERSATVTTDADGRATLPVTGGSDGYTVEATIAAPGPHREWSGGAAVQRLASPTTRMVTASAARRPDDGHLLVRKISADPTIGVEGAVFDLIDADGAVAATSQTDVDGLARFADIDRGTHRGPYSVVETAAPSGLLVSGDAVAVERLGTVAGDPPVVEVTNEPATSSLLVRKTLSHDAVGPGDRSGFEFTARRRTDGAEWRMTSNRDGSAGPVELPLGTYDVCETGVPTWAAGLVDTGCRTVEVTLDVLATTLEIVYVNEVPEPVIDTYAIDPSDGDQLIEIHQTEIVDRVQLDRLVPGTTYRVRGELVDAATGAPSGFVGQTEFTADEASVEVDVAITVLELPVGAWVVVEDVLVGDDVLARHADLGDADQTITVVAPPTTTTTHAPPTTTGVDATAPPTTIPTTTTSTTTSTTTTSTTTTSTTTTVASPPGPPPTLPPTGGDAVATALRLGDVGFVVGVGLVALTGLVPARRRSGRDGAGR